MDKKLKLKQINNPKMLTFQYGDEPEIIHLLKTGYDGEYFLIYQDGYESKDNGKIEFLNRKSLLKRFGGELGNLMNSYFDGDLERDGKETRKIVKEMDIMAETILNEIGMNNTFTLIDSLQKAQFNDYKNMITNV